MTFVWSDALSYSVLHTSHVWITIAVCRTQTNDNNRLVNRCFKKAKRETTSGGNLKRILTTFSFHVIVLPDMAIGIRNWVVLLCALCIHRYIGSRNANMGSNDSIHSLSYPFAADKANWAFPFRLANGQSWFMNFNEIVWTSRSFATAREVPYKVNGTQLLCVSNRQIQIEIASINLHCRAQAIACQQRFGSELKQNANKNKCSRLKIQMPRVTATN